MTSRLSIGALLAGDAFVPPALAQTQPAAPASTQPTTAAPAAAQPAPDATDDESDTAPEEIVVTGSRPRGSVVGDIPPENTLDSRDVRATGATNISELLDALAPQIGSAQGRG